MMNNVSAFQAIRVVTRSLFSDARHTFSTLMNVDANHVQVADRKSYLLNTTQNQSTDLLIIDIDAFGFDDACYLVFFAGIFSPETPVVLVTRNTMPQSLRRRCLQFVGVLDVIELADHDHALTTA